MKLTYRKARAILRQAAFAYKKEFGHLAEINGLAKEEWPGEPADHPGVIEVQVETADDLDKLPDEYHYTYKDGNTYIIPIKKVISGETKFHSFMYAGGPIWNLQGYYDGYVPGTCGAVVYGRDGMRYFLTCFHVLRYDQPWKSYWTYRDDPRFKASFQENEIGNMHRGYLGPYLDACIAKITEENVADEIIGIGKPSRYRKLDSADKGRRVMFKGRTHHKVRHAIIHDDDVVNEVIKYNSTLRHEFRTLYAIRSDYSAVANPKAPSTNGDSGALVVDEITLEGIGIVVGGDERLTYLIPLHRIFKRFELTFH